MKLLPMPISVFHVTKRLKQVSAVSMILLALGATASPQVYAASFSQRNTGVDFKKNDGKSRAAAQAQADHGGKVLSVSERQKNGQTVYKVKLLLDSGRIKIVTVPG